MTDDTDPAARGPRTISASQLFDDRRTGRFAVATVFALGAVLAGAVGWSAVMPLAEVSTSEGEVVTSEAVRRVQHLEGGIVARVLVEDGEPVEKGQVLVELAPTIAETELSQLSARLAGARVRIDLLTAALAGDLPDPATIDDEHRDIVAAEIQALSARRDSFESQIAVLRQQMAERQAELATLDVRRATYRTQIALGEEKIAAQRTLYESGNFPRLRIIDEERDLSRLQGERSEIESEKLRLEERIREAEARVAELQATFQADLAAEISALTKEAAEVTLALSKARDRVGRLTVAAPIAGRVQDLQIRSDGGVVAPGATLMSLVPDSARLRVEARVSTADVGHVKPGQPVKVKVQTFDYSRFGKIDGRIAQISPTTFLDPSGRPFFKATIDLAHGYVGEDETLALSPGMTVTADIVTGQRTLLDYLSGPIAKSLESGLRER